MDPARVAELRRQYRRSGLAEGELAADPLAQFGIWFAAAVTAGVHEPNAMVLATADAVGRPSTRTVLLKGYDATGFTFFTNYGSRKGRDLAANPQASLLFPWIEMERQVIVCGPAERLGRDESAAYFATRPYGSQLGAWASEQSAVVESREVFEGRFAAVAERWPEGSAVPIPDHWGGFRVLPQEVEFWQGRQDRLHDRLRYRRDGAAWVVERLSP